MKSLAHGLGFALKSFWEGSRFRESVAPVLLACISGVSGCPQIVGAQGAAAIPVRALRIVAASDSTTLRSVASVRSLPSGEVIVNDVSNRRLLRLNSALTGAQSIADTTAQLPYNYGLKAKPGALVPWRSDSSLFIDNDASAVLVVNPQGLVVNIVAAVKNLDLTNIVGGTYGFASGDGRGHLLYGTQPAFDPYAKVPGIGEPPVIAVYPDSNAIVRADFQSRKVDTVGMLLAPVQKLMLTRALNGNFNTSAAANPLPSSDDWTVLSDGTIAIIRAKDYHIDWIAPDGKQTSTPSMPFDWRSISPAEKKQMVDSVKRGMDEARAKQFAQGGATNNASAPTLNVTVDASDIPDNYPPVRPGTTRADLSGRVWLLPATSTTARNGLLYDVVNREGHIVERVQLPPGRALAGFGPGNIIYLNYVMGPNRSVLERAEIVR